MRFLLRPPGGPGTGRGTQTVRCWFGVSQGPLVMIRWCFPCVSCWYVWTMNISRGYLLPPWNICNHNPSLVTAHRVRNRILLGVSAKFHPCLGWPLTTKLSVMSLKVRHQPSIEASPKSIQVVPAQGGGGSFKNRKPIGEVGCCESGMAERSHWWTERCLISLTLSLSFSDYLPAYQPIFYISIYRSIDLSISLSLSLSSNCLSIYLSVCLSVCLSTCLSVVQCHPV